MFAIIIGIFIFVYLISSVVIVNQSHVVIIERFGKYYKTCYSGLNFIVPILDKRLKKIDLRTQVIDSPPQSVITRDNVGMLIDTVLYYSITDPFKSLYEIADLVSAVKMLSTTALRDVIGTLDLDETLSSREEINTRLRTQLDEATDPWGVKIERVEVMNIEPPRDIKEAMEQQMRAEREKRAAILKAEGEKQSAITTAEGQKQSAILRAEAAKEAAIRESEGRSIAIKTVAEAESENIKLIYNALKSVELDKNILALKSIQAFEELAKSPNKVFVPFESKNLLGNVGAIAELLQKQDETVIEPEVVTEVAKEVPKVKVPKKQYEEEYQD